MTAEPAPEGKGGRSEAEVCRAVAKTQTPAASTKNRKGSPQGGPFLLLAAVTAEPAPEGKGGRSEAEVCVAVAKTQTPAASTK